MNLLLLGGTSEARELVALLAADNVDVVTSLAGSVADPHPPEGTTRVGGFGGADGLADYLRGQHVDVVVDATHPFAGRMSANAAAACGRAGVPLLRLSRPSWAARPDAASWHWVDSIDRAREVAVRLGERVFLAIGRQSLGEFIGWTDRFVLARVVDLPDLAVPPSWTVLRGRGPFRIEDDLDLLRSHDIDVLVTKDSGGPTDAKLDAASELGVPVVMIRRPAPPEGVPVVTDVADVVVWLRGVRRGAAGQRRRSR
ncbi:cobalt-precorrin-6A reductase [Propioniciclava sp.]|uniref:cobalt-precorrin-6A reductase n=1 Tax=Propioniciclava sp. TaxID=2038686 RepID=UPI002628CEE3|nr:cobalt-precorrin-6A reductase [Propioniciclava sp.]